MARQTETKEREPLRERSNWFWSQKSVIGTPRTSSMTKYGRPDTSHRRQAIGRYWGEAIGARARRSGSKRPNILVGVHARLDDLERDHAANRVILLGDEHLAEAPLADRLTSV